MEKIDIFSKVDSAPTYLETDFSIDNPNTEIDIFKGEFQLYNKKIITKAIGRIYFDWLPFPSLRIEGEIIDTVGTSLDGQKLNVKVNGMKYGQFRIMIINSSTFMGLSVDHAVVGDINKPIDNINFNITNYNISLTTRGIQDGKEVLFNHYNLGYGDLEIVISKAEDHTKKMLKLANNHGYHLLGNGILFIKDKTFTYENVGYYFNVLNDFLCFLNGGPCGPILMTGKNEEKIVWRDYLALNRVEPYYMHNNCWLPLISDNSISNLWLKFTEAYVKNNDGYFYKQIIFWYNEALKIERVDNAIIFVQAGLELIYNWLEEKKLLPAKDMGEKYAYEKVKKLLKRINIPVDPFKEQKELIKYKNGNREILNGAHAIIYARNNLLHSDHKHTAGKHVQIPRQVKVEIVELGVFYIELLILNILDYQGEILNRITENRELVPWKIS